VRLWSLNPRFLDRQGLLACWREGLLAQAVLLGKTKGYTNHPQLQRFKASRDPVGAIGRYLWGICQEGVSRGYRFNHEKIYGINWEIRIPVTKSQITYETEHLEKKLRERRGFPTDGSDVVQIGAEAGCHPIFYPVEGDVEPWEKRSSVQVN
jgi:hypothetical protein